MKSILKSLIFIASLSMLEACGDGNSNYENSTNENYKNKKSSQTESSTKQSNDEPSINTTSTSESEGNRTFGPCTLSGTIKSFTVNCSKDIDKVRYLFFTSKKLDVKGTINGFKENLEIEVISSNEISGFDLNKSELSFVIIHTDGETTNIEI